MMKCFSLLGVVELPETRLNNNLKEKANKMKIVVENRKVARNWRKTKVLGGHQQSVFVSVDLKLVTWKDFHMATLSQGPGLCVRVYARRVYI